MATMIMRSLLTLFVCASLAACSSKDSGAPVHVGTNAKTQTNKDQTGRQPTDATPAGDQTVQAQDAQTQADDGGVHIMKDGEEDVDTKTQVVQQKAGQQQAQSQQQKSVVKKEDKTAKQSVTAKSQTQVQSQAKSQAAAKTQTSQSKKQNTKKQQTTQQQKQHKQKQKVASEPVHLTADQIRQMRGEASRFTGSSSDYLRNYLTSRENDLSDDQQQANLQMANRVMSASLDVDYTAVDGTGSGDTVMKVTYLNDKNQPKEIVLAGELDTKTLRTRLHVMKGGSGLKAELICMDKTDGVSMPTCETAIADVRGASGASVKIIFRRTSVNLAAKFPNQRCPTQECDDIYSMFSQTYQYNIGAQAAKDRLIIEDAKMESFEVINGRSAFRVLIRTVGNLNQVNQQRIGKQLIVFGAPLYTQDLLSTASMPVLADRDMKPEDLINYKTGGNYLSNLGNALKEINIVSNDGNGNLVAQVSVGNNDPSTRETFELDISRISADIRSITNMKLK